MFQDKLNKNSANPSLASGEGRKPSIWKISHGGYYNNINDKDGKSELEKNKPLFRKRKVVVVCGYTLPKGRSKNSQGESFIKEMKVGDFFYLCYGGDSVELLGQIIGDAKESEQMPGWYERKYRVIAKTKTSDLYQGSQKWWTPNNNSTCIRVKEGEERLFEKLILRPYFSPLDILFGTFDPRGSEA